LSQPSGPGFAEERTALAWRRTAVSVAVGAVLCLKLLPPLLGGAGVAIGVVGLCWSADLAWIGRRRHVEAKESTRPRSGVPLGGGAYVLRTAVVALAVGVTAAVVAVALAVGAGA
jgi:uncharacterized membrane protein YidH (DUF202 family)